MVATVGSIAIDLVTNASKFASGFKSSATTVAQESSRMAKSIANIERSTALAAGTLKTFVGGLAAGAGLAAIASLSGAFDTLKKTISEYDEIATNARQTGLKSDTYQALAIAANMANIDQESYNASLTIFAKNAGLAEKGTGALFEGLKKLNPQLLQSILNTQDQEERLKLVSDALAQTTDATQKAALAAVVFGKGGVQMAQFLDQGRASIDAMKKSAKDMGLIIPDDLLQKYGDIADKLELLGMVIKVQLGEAVIHLVPVLQTMTEKFADLARDINGSSSALDDFVNNPSWATLEKLIVSIGGAPFREDSILDRLTKGTLVAPGASDVKEVTDAIAFMEQKIAELQDQAAQGIDVHIELADAQQSLNDLEARLLHIQGVGVSAANEIRAGFAEAFRAAENASMAALASMNGAAAPGSLPNVTRYGGNPNQITLPGAGAPAVQTNVNGSGVDVTKYSSATADNTKDTAGYTKDTVDRVDQLDQNTGGYFRSLSQDMAGYSTNQVSAIEGLGSSISAQVDAWDASIAQLVAEGLNSGNISKPSNLFGDQWDPEYGSHIGDVLVGTRGHYQLSPTSSDGSYDTQVSVAQPGNSITLNYYAAAGESTETAKQRARDMWDELNLQASRA